MKIDEEEKEEEEDLLYPHPPRTLSQCQIRNHTRSQFPFFEKV